MRDQFQLTSAFNFSIDAPPTLLKSIVKIYLLGHIFYHERQDGHALDWKWELSAYCVEKKRMFILVLPFLLIGHCWLANEPVNQYAGPT